MSSPAISSCTSATRIVSPATLSPPNNPTRTISTNKDDDIMPPSSPTPQKKQLSHGSSASSSATMYTASGALGNNNNNNNNNNNDNDLQPQRSPHLAPKSLSSPTTASTPTPTIPSRAPTPACERSHSQPQPDLLIRTSTRSPKPEHGKRPSFKRSLSSLWKVLDPPELSHNTGALHNIAKQFGDDSAHRRRSASPGDVEREHTLLATISDKVYKQRI
ncbi:uncharacterized protein CLAFUR5_06633 [Fulvia fulva]|uniref:Uncharacterized protein n=1 Tax=Passalora fulva TaxID=5499 RepID=A0A9Q8LJ82_PASFU|nr:uncharacterized protein CLAFUR5_06633 [Fulvia fulva]UJO18499.1 hypothetical protein CLAFUR5_06633 [Fulvia fulva]